MRVPSAARIRAVEILPTPEPIDSVVSFPTDDNDPFDTPCPAPVRRQPRGLDRPVVPATLRDVELMASDEAMQVDEQLGSMNHDTSAEQDTPPAEVAEAAPQANDAGLSTENSNIKARNAASRTKAEKEALVYLAKYIFSLKEKHPDVNAMPQDCMRGILHSVYDRCGDVEGFFDKVRVTKGAGGNRKTLLNVNPDLKWLDNEARPYLDKPFTLTSSSVKAKERRRRDSGVFSAWQETCGPPADQRKHLHPEETERLLAQMDTIAEETE
ncbi:hypothetical protein IAU60_006896 [Kwoniella sp. DSM 27419]